MTIDERLTVCNLSIELGAKIGMIAPDDNTFEYLTGRPYAPHGEMFERAVVLLAKSADRRRGSLRRGAQH